ncbi:MAG: OmpP1/FadL family transporter [Polyangiaceae bacterium]
MPRDGRTGRPRRTDRASGHRHAAWAASAFACLAWSLAPGAARASGLLNPFVGDPHGQPGLANVYAVDFNPAALGGMRGTNLVADGALDVSYIAYQRTAPLSFGPADGAAGVNGPLYAASNTGKNTAQNAGFVPFLGASTDFGSRLFFAGVGLYAPFGGSIKWQPASRWANAAALPGAVDGPQRWQSISVVDTSVAVSAAFGVRILDGRLSLGLAVNGYDHSVQINKAFNSDGTDDETGPTGVLKEGRAYLNVSGVNAGVTAGLYAEPDAARRWRLGVSYASQPGFGQMRLPGTLEQRLGITPSASTDVDLLQTYPDIVRLGAAYRLSDDVDLRLHGEYVRWSVFTSACVVHRGDACDVNPDGSAVHQGQIIANGIASFNDAFAVHAGVGYWPRRHLETFADLGIDTSAVPNDAQGRILFDSLKVMGTLGLRYAFSDRFALAGSYTLLQYTSMTVTSQKQWQPPSGNPFANGSYASHVELVDLNASVSF